MTDKNPIEVILDKETAKTPTAPTGSVSSMLRQYSVENRANLLGFLLTMGYDEMCLVTCDAWKRNCGGLPKNSFVIVKLNQNAADAPGANPVPFLILAQVTETTVTPVSGDIQNTIFQIHKVQAQIDPLTNAELQWGALKANILGTYYDDGAGGIAFGNDVDNFMSPHFYEIYVPTDENLQSLINTFVDSADPIAIGRLRYTETETLGKGRSILIHVSPRDFVANRTALFGKTRMGKSNTIKVILDTMLRTQTNLGQIVFDLSGEYTYPDPQTGSSLYMTHHARCTRYSLFPREPEKEKQAGFAPPAILRTNFYQHVPLGYSIITALYDTVHQSRPDYMSDFFAWDPVETPLIKTAIPDIGEQTRYRRALSMYMALLHMAGFPGSDRLRVPLELHAALRRRLAENPEVQKYASLEKDKDGYTLVEDMQPLPIAANIYQVLWGIYSADRNNGTLFPVSKSSGKQYFEGLHRSLLQMLGSSSISGPRKITPFTRYHDPRGGDLARSIVDDVQSGKTVLIDLAQADELVATFYTEMLTKAILARQMEKFSTMERPKFEEHSVLFYFEEAHNLFRADDKDLRNVYNKLAKEGAKFRIGMVYATQSMTTLSPDLLKNTENFFIAHMNDDREVKEIERRYEFRHLGLDIQRARSKGYVRMITLSHRFAIPVQIQLFAPHPLPATGALEPKVREALPK